MAGPPPVRAAYRPVVSHWSRAPGGGLKLANPGRKMPHRPSAATPHRPPFRALCAHRMHRAGRNRNHLQGQADRGLRLPKAGGHQDHLARACQGCPLRSPVQGRGQALGSALSRQHSSRFKTSAWSTGRHSSSWSSYPVGTLRQLWGPGRRARRKVPDGRRAPRLATEVCRGPRLRALLRRRAGRPPADHPSRHLTGPT